ncbi:MAG: FAD-binding oxidoreductase [Candidatus Bathyarchaeota archaeon]|nr:MAG: FAD-binding oxidoreductase [Candidatus Bathyarchaeota archaeon]
MKPELISAIRDIVGEEWLLSDRDPILDYLIDETTPAVLPTPADDVIVVKPSSTQEISNLLKFANENGIPVFPRGGGTGLVAGSVPTSNGIILSLERMNRVIEVDQDNLMMTAEAGVTLLSLKKAAAEAGLSFPLHPGDESAQLGGMVACGAGGASAVKHGVISDYVKGMEVVLPIGEVLTLKGKLLKDVAGYDLMHLLIGSQGTLGIITKVTLRLHPELKETITLVIPYNDRYQTLQTVPEILQEGIVPLAIEFVERNLMEKSARKLGKSWSVKAGKYYLIIVLAGRDRNILLAEAEGIHKIAQKHNAIDTLIVQNKRKQDDILNIRGKIYFALKPITMDITDIAVAPSKIAEFLSELDKLAAKYGMYMPVFGHAGDGNLHTHILTAEAGGLERANLEKVKKEIYDAAIQLGGTITAEHGIGKIRRKEFKRYTDKKLLGIMKAVKDAFDPNNILNPGTVLPDEL